MKSAREAKKRELERLARELEALGAELRLAERKARIESEVRRLLGLDAARLRTESDEHEYWVVMADPEANEFCVQ